MLRPIAYPVPDQACPTGFSPLFSETTVPAALRARHTLAPGNWATLFVTAGSLRFFDLRDGEETTLRAGQWILLEPGQPHRVEPGEAVLFQLEFYRANR